jgi:hypothetical protein
MGKVVYFVVGDQKLDAGGGVFVRDLEELKARLMKTSPKGDWHLVIGMHGSVELLSTVGGVVDAANRPKDLKLYFKDDIDKLFAQDQQISSLENPIRAFSPYTKSSEA